MAQSLQLQKMSPRYEAVLNYILVNPKATGPEIAAAFGVSSAWISIVRNSDAFKRRMKQRQEELNAMLDTTIVDRLHRITGKTLDHIEKRIDDVGEDLPLPELRETADFALKRLGYGEKPERAPANNTNVLVVSADVLKSARENAERVMTQKPREMIDVTPESAPT